MQLRCAKNTFPSQASLGPAGPRGAGAGAGAGEGVGAGAGAAAGAGAGLTGAAGEGIGAALLRDSIANEIDEVGIGAELDGAFAHHDGAGPDGAGNLDTSGVWERDVRQLDLIEGFQEPVIPQ